MRSVRTALQYLLPLLLTASATPVFAGPDGRPALQRRYKPGTPALPAQALMTTKEGTQHLDEGHYKSVRDAALAMMKRFPPANHFYLSLGRSPVSIHSFLKGLDPDITATFPASDLRLGINAAHHGEYFKHFERYIPADVLRGYRGDIVLFDRSHDRQGSSLARLKPLLEQYLASKGYKTKVIALGFAGQGPLQAGVEFQSTQAFPRVFLYFNGADHDENVATYVGHHTIGTHAVEQLQFNPQHDTFQNEMNRRMAADPELDQILATEPHLRSLSE
jgi:hypothetical protein